MVRRTVIIGGGQAAISMIAEVRQLAPDRAITLIGDEPWLPYQRPPLSKAYLGGEWTIDRLALRPAEWFASEGIDTRLGVSVEAIDRKSAKLHLSDGSTLSFDDLVLCTGARARPLPEALSQGLKGIYTLRGIADADALRSEMQEGRHVLIIGGGYIGLEFAAIAVKSGLKVTLVEAAERILGRVAAAETADYFRALHRAKGVDLREATQVAELSGNPHVKRAYLSDGDVLDVDFVVAGIGAVAADDLARDAGLTISNGIAVDDHCRTSDERILAAGDCTSFIRGETRLRLESVQNAIEQGEAAAATLAGSTAGRKFSPWFWSDQYDTKLQIAGVSQGYDRVVRRPAKREGAQSIWYLKAEKLIAVDAINDPASYMTGRRLIDAGVTPAPEEIADPAFALVKLAGRSA
ncbi:NAD(P)/FAD-dependent oxidoreductase [Taklimakanibacter deserti]|uniref:NAD(P)/FAD-dependent oxidoreductase n=1 Tax=Taklimakanibacter deserti TaxID=2267839 RepID=UPI000E64F618